MPEQSKAAKADGITVFLRESAQFWRSLPSRGAFLVMLASWVVLFQFFGNSTLGLVNTKSLFGWWTWTINKSPDEGYAFFMPLITLGLLLWKRKDLGAIPKRICWPALGIVFLALLLHVFGFMIQQARVSLLAFVLGLFGLTGLVWGGRWLGATLFPFSLLAFCMPLGDGIEPLTFQLRLISTKITAVICNTVLGIPVLNSGTRLAEPGGSYLYDVAPACSGIQSLTAIVVLGVVYSFVTIKSFWRRSLLVASALPLAVVGNVFRLALIVVAAEAFGQEAGNYVHSNNIFSMAPYVPAILGMLLLGYWLEEDRKPKRAPNLPVEAMTESLLVPRAKQKP